MTLSPDGKRVAFVAGNPATDIWVLDLERKTKTRITFEETVQYPAWSPESKTLAFAVTQAKAEAWSKFAVERRMAAERRRL